MLVEKSNDVLAECAAVLWFDSLAKNVEGLRLGTEVPATERDDSFDIIHVLEHVELLFCTAYVYLEVCGDVCKCPVDVGVLLGIDLIDVHIEAFAVDVPRLKVGNFDCLLRRTSFDNLSTTARDTYRVLVSLLKVILWR